MRDENNEILVSICCITYNHEKYIRDAIEGFLMQKTDFPFEVLIHDDASTDGIHLNKTYCDRWFNYLKYHAALPVQE